MTWKRLYKPYSVCEKGTLYQLRNVITRRNVKPNPKDNVNAADDFITVITTCQILAAAVKIIEMEDLMSMPVNENLDENTWKLHANDRNFT